jgi:Arc/MetJ-type ribon-helix-helix transcriptional regulator
MKNCLSNRFHRIIQDAMQEGRYPTPLDAICRALDLLSEHEDEEEMRS